MYILGLNSAYHESSVALIRDGELLFFAEEERFNRVKHGKESRIENPDELPVLALEYCLKQAGIKPGDIAFVGLGFDPQTRFNKNRQLEYSYPLKAGEFGTLKGEQRFLEANQNIRLKLRDMGFNGETISLSHHLCHAASSYYVSGFDEALVLVVDGIGEFESTSLYRGQGKKLNQISELAYPHSLGFLWEKLCLFLGFSTYDACKVMGLASYGDAKIFEHQINQLIQIDDSGSFKMNDQLLCLRSNEFKHLESVLGVPKRKYPVQNICSDTQAYADIAAALQVATEKSVMAILKSAKQQFPSKNLCLAGGVALNCVMNSKIIEAGWFENVYVQPAANDAGTALGAALEIDNNHIVKNSIASNQTGGYAASPIFNGGSHEPILTGLHSTTTHLHKRDYSDNHQYRYSKSDKNNSPSMDGLGNSNFVNSGLLESLSEPAHSFKMNHAYWGPEYDQQEIQRFFNQYRLTHSICELKTDQVIEQTASLLAQNFIVGWFQGKMEVGPRALGNRSLLANPAILEISNYMNRKVKHREPFRPFCPSVLEQYAAQWFEFSHQSPHNFMLAACRVKEQKKQLIPSVVHHDGTARIQIVTNELNFKFHQLIEAFYRITGIPLLLNTSFNDQEPIVCSPEDAIKTFLKTDIDYLVMGDLIIEKSK